MTDMTALLIVIAAIAAVGFVAFIVGMCDAAHRAEDESKRIAAALDAQKAPRR